MTQAARTTIPKTSVVIVPAPAPVTSPSTIPPHRRILEAASTAVTTPAPAIPSHLRILYVTSTTPTALLIIMSSQYSMSQTTTPKIPVVTPGTGPIELPPPSSPLAPNPPLSEQNQKLAPWPTSLVGKAFRFSQLSCYHHQKTVRWYATTTLLICEKQVVPRCVK